MKHIIKVFTLLACLTLFSCQGLVDGINDNPNDILISDIEAELFLTGALLGNSLVQGGHLNRISGMYSGQLVGIASLYSNIYGFSLSTAESVSTWVRIYVSVVPNLRHIRESNPEDKLLVGMAKIVEAHAVGTGASIFGDVPYLEINNPDIEDPKFDSQVSVFNACIALLEDGIKDLEGAKSRAVTADIYFEGDKDKWIEAAYTILARYHLQMRNYPAAYTAASKGISSHAGSLQHIPRGESNVAVGDKNMFWEILEGSRAGDIGTVNSYLMQLIDPANSESRNNAKTHEAARFGYYTIDESGGFVNQGIVEQYEPQNLVSYAENQLILAEAGARTQNLATGLAHLNDLRGWLDGGNGVNANFQADSIMYAAYDAADFNSGGIENTDGIDPLRALLREIIEERYISGFGSYIPYNDARRLRKGDTDIAVPFILVDGPSGPYPERMPYSADELNSNANAPDEDPGIFVKTEVNR